MKKKQHKKVASQDNSQKVFTMGKLDLTLKIDFRDEDLVENNEGGEEPSNQNGKTTKNFEDLNAIKDLDFIKNNKKLLNRIKVTSQNEMIKLLLIGNKNSKKKYKIDHICYGFPQFQEEEKFFSKILENITEKNGLILNPSPLSTSGDFHIKIEMTHNGEKKEINLGPEKEDSHEDDNEIMEEGKTKVKDEEPVEEDDEDEYGDYEPNEMMKLGFIPKFRRKKSVLCKLEPTTAKFDMIYLNYEEFGKIPGNFKMEDMIELLGFFKKKKSKIFINYYKGESATEEDKNKKKENQKEEEEKEGKDEKNDEKAKNDENKDKKNQKKKEPSKEMKELNLIYYLTDIYFFDKKQAVNEFDAHYKSFTEEEKKKIDSRNVYDYFIKGIATGTAKEVPCEKTGIFLDEFNKFCIIHISKIKTKNEDDVISLDKKEFNPQPFPKINTHNMEEVQKYKDIIKQNKNELYNLFLSEMVTTMGTAANNATKPELIYPSYLTGIDFVKKKLEFLKNNIEIENEEEFYKIKRDPKVIDELLEKLIKDQKEGSFKLDCTNLITSNKKEYVSLYDYHLKNFFSQDINRKELRDKGFINQEGYIRYDPVYRSVMGSNSMNKKTYTEEEKKNSLITTIKEINVHNRIKDKEIDCRKEVLKKTPLTNKKIPFTKSKQKSQKKKGKKKSNEGGSSSDSGSSDEGSRSQENINTNKNKENKNSNQNKENKNSNQNKDNKSKSQNKDDIVFLKDMLVY